MLFKPIEFLPHTHLFMSSHPFYNTFILTFKTCLKIWTHYNLLPFVHSAFLTSLTNLPLYLVIMNLFIFEINNLTPMDDYENNPAQNMIILKIPFFKKFTNLQIVMELVYEI